MARFLVRNVMFALLAIMLAGTCVPIATGRTKGTSTKAPTTTNGGKHVFMWCWAAQLRSYEDRSGSTENKYFSQVFPVSSSSGNVGDVFGKWVKKVYHVDFDRTGIGNGECSSYGNAEEAHGSRDLAIRAWKENGPTMHPPMQDFAVDTIWSYGTTAWVCSGTENTNHELTGIHRDYHPFAISVHPDGSLETYGWGYLGLNYHPDFDKGVKEGGKWHLQADGTLVVSQNEDSDLRTYFFRLNTGNRPPTGYFEINTLGDRKFPLTCDLYNIPNGTGGAI